MEKNIEGLLKSEEEKEQGNIFFKNGDYELAIFHYTRSINYVADNSVVYTNRSLAYFKMGAFENSLKDALRAKELDENNLKKKMRAHKNKNINNNYYNNDFEKDKFTKKG
ncbi:hypothetical protein PFLG_01684 [Plasmodium falciparum RAJ116]|uniref:Uncharacterized protein n=1 Tax=Plasmodium falciparum RAJ116 TaxID=580058 RepID=A0A0L0CX82_PLAFA|nr:hypothetical protein PFLG_01684 [Plasmodium falciparum RAJ116]